MPLPVPNLDDRDFQQLMEAATRVAAARCPEWTDRSPGDPGAVLLELFAYLTDTMLYRLNRLPDKAYVAFLNLIGVQLAPPTAASVTLRLQADDKVGEGAVEAPRHTRVSVGAGRSNGDDPVFITTEAVTVRPGEPVEVTALHAAQIAGELVGTGTGLPGLTVRVAQPPIVARGADGFDLMVGVEARGEELSERVATVQHDGVPYRVWREVRGFSDSGDDPHVYTVDRVAGLITFAPAVRAVRGGGLDAMPEALAAVPGRGRPIRVWYRRGGGAAGNVAAGTLTKLVTPIAGLTVTNPAPATGGRDVESVANAVVRGPQQLHTSERAITARDYEQCALNSSGAIVRARAVTRADLWRHAVPGTVEVIMVPAAPDNEALGPAELEARHTPDALARVQAELELRRPMGTRVDVSWARYKTVRVSARVVVHRAEDVDAVRARLTERLRRTISPLPNASSKGWRFGEALRVSTVYDALLAERGVRYADRVRLFVDEVPSDVRAIEADHAQPNTWYCASGPILFRSLDGGDGWEASGRFEGETVETVRTSPHRPGLVVIACRPGAEERSRLRVSFDCGESWEAAADLNFHVEDVAVVWRDDSLLLLLATDRGLFELALRPGAVPVQVLVDAARQDLGFYAVAAITSVQGDLNVMVAAQERGGVFVSPLAGRPGTYRPLAGLTGKDVRVLVTRVEGPRRFVIAGVTASGAEPGEGAHMVEIVGTQISAQGWQQLTNGWRAGSCQGLAIQGRTLLAASHSLGVMRLDLGAATPVWRAPDVACGLPMRDPGRFAPLTAVVASPDGRVVLAGGPVIDNVAAGVHRSGDGGEHYQSVCERELTDRVSLPPTWLFCSGEHDIEVVIGDAPG
jgi:hypothetical protein